MIIVNNSLSINVINMSISQIPSLQTFFFLHSFTICFINFNFPFICNLPIKTKRWSLNQLIRREIIVAQLIDHLNYHQVFKCKLITKSLDRGHVCLSVKQLYKSHVSTQWTLMHWHWPSKKALDHQIKICYSRK